MYRNKQNYLSQSKIKYKKSDLPGSISELATAVAAIVGWKNIANIWIINMWKHNIAEKYSLAKALLFPITSEWSQDLEATILKSFINPQVNANLKILFPVQYQQDEKCISISYWYNISFTLIYLEIYWSFMWYKSCLCKKAIKNVLKKIFPFKKIPCKKLSFQWFKVITCQ